MAEKGESSGNIPRRLKLTRYLLKKLAIQKFGEIKVKRKKSGNLETSDSIYNVWEINACTCTCNVSSP